MFHLIMAMNIFLHKRINNFRLLIPLTILIMGMSQPSYADQDFCQTINRSFKSGEVLNFKVYYNMGAIWVGAGTASFTASMVNYNGKQAYHIVGEGQTLKNYEWFYKVRDKYESYVEANSMLPLKFIRNVNEGSTSFTNNVTFHQNLNRATSTNGSFNIPDCTQDVLSAIYFARNINFNKFKPGDKIPFHMFLDDEVHHLYIRYMGKERITTKFGTFNTIKISPLLIEGTLFKGGEKMSVWVTDDENHIPVRVDSPILVGSIKVDLVGYKNLRHPLKALLKKK